MVQCCCVIKCGERSRKGGGISFHSFPSDETMKRKWIIATRRNFFYPNPRTRICSKHFIASDYIKNFGQLRLKKDAVPTIFNFSLELVKTQLDGYSSGCTPTSSPIKVETEEYLSEHTSTSQLIKVKAEECSSPVMKFEAEENTLKYSLMSVPFPLVPVKIESSILPAKILTRLPSSDGESHSFDSDMLASVNFVEISEQSGHKLKRSISSDNESQNHDSDNNILVPANFTDISRHSGDNMKRNSRIPTFFGHFKYDSLKSEEAKILWQVAKKQIDKHHNVIHNLRRKQQQLERTVKNLKDVINDLRECKKELKELGIYK